MIENRYDFVILFDVENGNPNGDPDAGNSPRVDAETGYGFVTDVCIKRKIRNYVELVKNGEKGYNILIKPDKVLNEKFEDVYISEGLKLKEKGKNDDNENKARDFMCRNYFDVRTFGAVMSTGEYQCGIVRGPVQIGFSRSVSPVNIQDITITRQARTTIKREATGKTEFGKKSIIPYALYRAEGHISAAHANNATDMTEEDVELLWQAIENMFEEDHSAARGEMNTRRLYIFKHDSVLGNSPAYKLFEKIKIKEKETVAVPRKFDDYEITVDEEMPEGVTLICR
ncbi:type I-C CRISPR-associated protein Cas7/Csd2 [Lachnospiraceae bacterium NSJ-143]|nr:type I-C CRISPR-associated protein Cas7/Csd2 [Lachnospiraceae bacterium NSJ-143]